MNKQTQVTRNDTGTLAEDAHALMAATADVAGEKVGAPATATDLLSQQAINRVVAAGRANAWTIQEPGISQKTTSKVIEL